MGLLGYQDWKADLVEAGVCRQTIRASRRYPVKVGDRLYHYRGLRTPNARKLRAGVQDFCQQTFPVELRAKKGGSVWIVDGTEREKTDTVLLDIATRDGFGSVEAMTDWFLKNHKPKDPSSGLLFKGDVIRW